MGSVANIPAIVTECSILVIINAVRGTSMVRLSRYALPLDPGTRVGWLRIE